MAELRELHALEELVAAERLFAAIWRTPEPPVSLHILRALAHAGSYVAGAFEDGELVGASAGFVGLSPELHLHSHITGVRQDARSRSIGFDLKQHQRAWCLDRDIEVVRWTFDPLVRRNAWFNLQRLGATVESFHESFYGDMTDGVNAGDLSDRFVVRWDLPDAGPREVPAGDELFALPEDIVGIRAEDPARALRWRLDLREAMRGMRVLGVTRGGEYVLVRA